MFLGISLQWPFVQCNEWSGLGGSEAIVSLDGVVGGKVVEKIGGTYWTAVVAAGFYSAIIDIGCF